MNGTADVLRQADHASTRFRAAQNVATGVLLALAITAMRSMGREGHVDLALSDEAFYIWHAQRLFSTPIDPAYGPLYCGFLRLLLVFVPDPAHLFYVGWSAILFLTLLSQALLLRALKLSWLVTFCVLALLSTLHLFEGRTFSSHFAAALLGFACLWAVRAPSLLAGLFRMACALAVLSYARPELETSLLIVLVVMAFVAFRSPDERGRWRTILVPAAMFVLLGGLFGRPGGGGRLMFAFAQHFAANVARERGSSLGDPWGEWEAYFKPAFGTATTLREAIRANPEQFFWHIGVNVRQLPAMTLGMLKPVGIPVFSSIVPLLMCVGLLLSVLAIERARADTRRTLVLLFIVTGAMVAPALASLLLIGTEPRYLLEPFVVCTGLAALGFLATGITLLNRTLAVVLVAAVLTLPSSTLSEIREPLITPHRQMAEALRSLNIGERHVVSLEGKFGYCVYGGLNCDIVHKEECAPLARCLSQVDVIVSNGELVNYYKARNDPDMARLETDPSQVGFVRVQGQGARSPSFHARPFLLTH